MASQKHHQPHFIFIPLMAPGHMIPMVDMARLFAKRGVLATIITTPFNAARLMTTIDQAIESGLPIQLVQLPFPSREAGLPNGCENFDSIPLGASPDLYKNFFTALDLLEKPVEQFLEGIQPVPNCIISDVCFPWTSETARKLGIPRLVFHGTCCYALLFAHNLHRYRPFERVASEHEPFVVPGLHHRIEITKAQCPVEVRGKSVSEEQSNRMREAEYTCYGVMSNSFNELEPEYVEKYQETIGKKVWTIGPVSLCNKETSDKAARGNKASISESQCLTWLDSKKANSVVYACFGTVSNFFPKQLIEIGLGLEASNRPFILVIRHSSHMSTEWIVQVQRIAVSAGAKATVDWGQQKVGEIVNKEEIVTAVERLMDEGEEGEERRKRARELAETAKRAMEEDTHRKRRSPTSSELEESPEQVFGLVPSCSRGEGDSPVHRPLLQREKSKNWKSQGTGRVGDVLSDVSNGRLPV
ncbi:hypothetical protein MRB53_031321 [Persea americana]|uniref:Uncharacterized protein n=1 Tax=Persea americana TaxID=3435 RepID=A0ACC2KP28_PERAE|nr:hypothetical protein MRB53_031321 [Persea americana]